jgi:hypothetical protein
LRVAPTSLSEEVDVIAEVAWYESQMRSADDRQHSQGARVRGILRLKLQDDRIAGAEAASFLLCRWPAVS